MTTVQAAQPTEHTMTLWDGTELFYRAWCADGPTDKALLLFHRGHEHSGRFLDVVDELGLDELPVFAWDARGHGRSPGERGYAPSFACMVKDVDCFARHVSETYGKPLENIVVMAHSVGAVTAAAWVHDFAPPIRAMVLLAPALRVKLYVPLAVPGLRLLRKLKGNAHAFVKSYVKARMLTHDAEQAQRYNDDPLIARAIAVNILLDLHDAATRLIDDAGAIRVPTLLLAAGADWVVKLGAQRRFFDRLGSPVKRMRVFEEMYHDLLHEADRRPVLDEVRQFIRDSLANGQPREPMLDADRRGYTKDEYDRLRRPLPLFSPRRGYFAMQKLVMQTLGQLSCGVRLGWQSGFDSGRSLDYVYENRAQGALLLGKWIDRLYLNSVGWRGIRQRKVNLEKLLREAITHVRADGRTVRLVDIAAGAGRYVLEAIKECDDAAEISALLRDNTPANLEAGWALAGQLGLANVEFELGDAFDEASLAALNPPPNVAVVSGLYELFPENAPVLASLRGLAAALRRGYLVYTGQPWHPQVEMIARVLSNRDGAPWIMRRRTQEEMDDLVRSAGFEKLAMEVDQAGIFTVSLARTVHGVS